MASLISLAMSIFPIVCMWFIFEKAGEAGWKALIPIYNGYILAKIANRKWTFWVQFIGSVLMSIFLIVAVLGIVTATTRIDTSHHSEYKYDSVYEDEYYETEDDYTMSEDHILTGDIYVNGEKLTDEEVAELEANVDELMTEMGPAIGAILAAILISFLFLLPMTVVTFCQYIGLAKAFGMHWAFAFVLLLINPVGLGVLAFAPDIRYVGNMDNDAPVGNSTGTYAASAYSPIDPAVTNTNRCESVSQARVASDISATPQADGSSSMKHLCPNCRYESEKEPSPDTFCPNCGHLYRG